jgi:hypothetical protein
MINIYSSKTQTVSETFENIESYRNIIDYKYHHCSPVLELQITENNIISDFNSQEELNLDDYEYYFIFDGPGEDAIGHWIFESFIFYPILLKLKQKYKNIKIITKNTKKYVKLIFDLFEINCDVLNNIPNDSNKNKIYFFPPVLSLNDNELNSEIYNYFIINYREYIIKNILLSFKQKNKILFLPRNTVDNYSTNDRQIPFKNEIKDYVINTGGIVLNSYDTNNLFIQFNIVNNSEIIILDLGGSFSFNCLFINNKKILLLTTQYSFDTYYNNYISMKIPFDIISNNNKVIIIDITCNDVIQQIQNAIES